MAKLPSEFESIVHSVVNLLANRQYLDLENLSSGVRLPATQVANAVNEYGRTICLPTPPSLLQLDVIELNIPGETGWSVRVPLWTIEEGRSDMSLDLTLLVTPGGPPKVEIDDILVH
jgi:hypothetical protein